MLNAIHSNASPFPRVRVLVVDDSVVIRKILSDALRDDPEIELVGTASNGVTALQRLAQLAPDVVTLDIEMPEMDGISTLREIKKNFPRTRVIMCSTLTERGASITMEALSSGADDYIAKSAGSNAEKVLESFQSQLLPKIKQFSRRSGTPSGTGRAGLFGDKPAALPTNNEPRTAWGAASGPRVVPMFRQARSKPQAIAIGVSTGGPNALAEVIPALPADFPLPVFVVQHMPPMFTRLLAERLQSQSKVKVVEGAEGMVAMPGCVYIAPGDHHMCVTRRGTQVVLRMNREPMENSCRPAVDVLFRSVADVYGGATVAVILTGMGQDGLRGVEQLRQLGSYVIAQDEASSVVWGMPGFVVRAGLADSVCDLKTITPQILNHI